jgi:hypothetical protein
MNLRRNILAPATVLLLLALGPSFAPAYSVLTHQQIVDFLWTEQIQPLLLKRFPSATAEDLRKAHAYAYGGSVVQDMGYYPFGSKYFSDLAHYVRSGDFVEALLRDSSDVNDYAFALGALAHYVSDNTGHPAINRIAAIEFPKLRAKYGEEVTYADDPKAHIRTEFGFDMVQVAKNRYTSDRYHDFIGFAVSKPLLERAFLETYGMKLEDIEGDTDLAIGSFRRAVSVLIPEMTRVALLSRHDQIVKDTPNFDKRKFLYDLSRADYRREWGTVYRRPGIGTRILAFFLRLIPKVGPFSAVVFKIPTQQTEDMYIRSVDLTVDSYSSLLRQLGHGQLDLANRDCDTGRDTRAGEYVLTDRTYARLLDDLSNHSSTPVPAELRTNILNFYYDLNAPIATRTNKKAWRRLLAELSRLHLQSPEPQPERLPVANP